MYAVVPAGGSGTRLWPLSRSTNPKFLHALTGDRRSLIRGTLDRLAPLVPADRTYVVTGGAHAADLARALPELPARNILVEPGPRDSAPAIGLAAAIIERRDPGAVMGSFASDHVVRDEAAFRAAVTAAAQVAADGLLVTVGIAPTSAATGFGYIRRGAELTGLPGCSVEQFVEKPDRQTAEDYLATGRYLWNASMFCWRTDAFLAELARQQPELHAGLVRIAESWDGPDEQETLTAIWPTLPKVTVDIGVMEDAAARGRVATVPGDFGWDDIGDWDTLGELLPADDTGNVLLGRPEDVLTMDAMGSVLVPAGGRLIALVGVDDVIVVDTPDAVLVCRRESAQEVKECVAALRERGRTDLI